MRKINFLAVMLCVCPMMMFGQLEVMPNGNTVIYSQGRPNTGTAQLTVNSEAKTGVSVNSIFPNTSNAAIASSSMINATLQYTPSTAIGV